MMLWTGIDPDPASMMSDAYGHGRLHGLFNRQAILFSANRQMQLAYEEGHRDGKANFDLHGAPTMPSLHRKAA